MNNECLAGLLRGVEEAYLISRGEMVPARVTRVEVPFRPGDVRRRLGLTQLELAERLEVPLSKVKSWERGRSYPSGACGLVFRIAEEFPETVEKLLKSV